MCKQTIFTDQKMEDSLHTGISHFNNMTIEDLLVYLEEKVGALLALLPRLVAIYFDNKLDPQPTSHPVFQLDPSLQKKLNLITSEISSPEPDIHRLRELTHQFAQPLKFNLMGFLKNAVEKHFGPIANRYRGMKMDDDILGRIATLIKQYQQGIEEIFKENPHPTLAQLRQAVELHRKTEEEFSEIEVTHYDRVAMKVKLEREAEERRLQEKQAAEKARLQSGQPQRQKLAERLQGLMAAV